MSEQSMLIFNILDLFHNFEPQILESVKSFSFLVRFLEEIFLFRSIAV